ncbi:unnamed protein product [Paramecium sonneborni]|uniref:Uncharacterized protein n=1 Tax=Paramecium sonneborni TaxID=65129 RepID=A0A8S1QW06_9CILI|nr:unnamed protein product [Paramecium sonneborni]
MSNTKFVFQKKVHKIPPNVTNLKSLIETIKSIYKQLNTIYLFAIINPEETDSVAEIRNDNDFQQLIAQYKQNQWPTIKLLVTETQDYKQILKDSWGVLNQSMVGLDNKQSKDVCTLSQPIQIDQSQQVGPQSGNQSTQVQVNQIDNGQNTNQIDFRQNEQLKQLIADIVDQRLRELQLMNKNPQENFKVTLTSKIPIFTAIPGRKIIAQMTILNSGVSQWINASLENRELEIYQKLSNVSRGECVTVTIDLPYVPEHFSNQEQKIYKFYVICNNEKQQLQKIENPIEITVKAPQQDIVVQQLQNLFPQKKREDLVKYVNEKGINKSYDEIVEMLLQEY